MSFPYRQIRQTALDLCCCLGDCLQGGTTLQIQAYRRNLLLKTRGQRGQAGHVSSPAHCISSDDKINITLCKLVFFNDSPEHLRPQDLRRYIPVHPVLHTDKASHSSKDPNLFHAHSPCLHT